MKRFPTISVLDLWCIVWTVSEHMRIVARRSDAVIVPGAGRPAGPPPPPAARTGATARTAARTVVTGSPSVAPSRIYGIG